MTDLITRLRSRLWPHQGDVNHWKLRDEAADEIERLRALADDRLAQMQADRAAFLRLRAAAQQARAALDDFRCGRLGYLDTWAAALRALDEALK